MSVCANTAGVHRANDKIDINLMIVFISKPPSLTQSNPWLVAVMTATGSGGYSLIGR
jgi:hypothetical protein